MNETVVDKGFGTVGSGRMDRKRNELKNMIGIQKGRLQRHRRAGPFFVKVRRNVKKYSPSQEIVLCWDASKKNPGNIVSNVICSLLNGNSFS